MGAGAWGQEHLGGIVRMVAIFLTFFLMIYLKNKSSYDSKDFFPLAWKRGVESNYFFPNHFSDLIVSWEQECGDGSIWAQTLYFRGDGIVRMGAFWRDSPWSVG